MNWKFANGTGQSHWASEHEFKYLRIAILERPQFYEIEIDTERLLLYWFTDHRRRFCGYVREDMLQ